MPYIPVTETQRGQMLSRLGVNSIADLFTDIPEKFRFPALNLGRGLSEHEVLAEINSLAEQNLTAGSGNWFLGAGAYNHFIPAAVSALAGRGEFLTAYTPYQSEVSQGTLQAIFEYQSMIAELFGVDVVNAGHYDGATALAEAVILALKNNEERSLVLLPEALHPEYREVLATYLCARVPEIKTYTGSPADAARAASDKNAAGIACLVAAYPDFSGAIPDLSGAAAAVHDSGGLFIVHADPLMLGLFKSPGEYGADIVTAEGQSLGNDINYGGPFLGIMGVKKELMRKIPGRIAGQASDARGRRGFVLTLSAREQHIRREKAVSNICSNQGLSMLRSCVYLALMGKEGLKTAAELCWNLSHYAAQAIAAQPGFTAYPADGNFFREFIVKLPGEREAEKISEKLIRKNIVPGLPLSRYFPGRKNELLICVTEKNSRSDIDRLAESIRTACDEEDF
ncbi:MAG: aminomethyl-transferring glycine dehydrogenase subunit GcvPA [Treponema sp.]|nr:aminomethyl-transferring glycine dehydrogenase subunit GcvPA [Treponema sp.]